MAMNMSSLVLHASEGEVTFAATGEHWIWKVTAEATNGRYEQAVTITLPQAGPPNIPVSKRNCSTFWRGPIG